MSAWMRFSRLWELSRRSKTSGLLVRKVDVKSASPFAFDSGFGVYTGAQDTGLTQATPNTNRANDTSVLVDFTDPAPTTNAAQGLMRFTQIRL